MLDPRDLFTRRNWPLGALLAGAFTVFACDTARDTAADSAAADLSGITVDSGPALSPLDLTAEEAAAGVRLPGLLVAAYGCTAETVTGEGSCWPIEHDVIGGAVYPRSGAVSYRLWILR